MLVNAGYTSFIKYIIFLSIFIVNALKNIIELYKQINVKLMLWLS